MSSTTTLKLFSLFILGTITLRHRVVMAPLTRLRSDQPGDVPGDLMAEYYAQRASPGGTHRYRVCRNYSRSQRI